jgi:hypothetical protein
MHDLHHRQQRVMIKIAPAHMRQLVQKNKAQLVIGKTRLQPGRQQKPRTKKAEERRTAHELGFHDRKRAADTQLIRACPCEPQNPLPGDRAAQPP